MAEFAEREKSACHPRTSKTTIRKLTTGELDTLMMSQQKEEGGAM
jgi:hypothetical protein